MLQERIRQLRKLLGLTQAVFARELGVTRDIISNYENGRVTPKMNFLLLLCRVYNVRESWLLDGDGEMFADERSARLVEEAITIVRSLSPKMQGYAVKLLRDLQELQDDREP